MSARRRSARATIRFEMLAHAISSTNTTAATSTPIGSRLRPVVACAKGCSSSGCILALGTCISPVSSRQISMARRRSARASLRLRPSASRATTLNRWSERLPRSAGSVESGSQTSIGRLRMVSPSGMIPTISRDTPPSWTTLPTIAGSAPNARVHKPWPSSATVDPARELVIEEAAAGKRRRPERPHCARRDLDAVGQLRLRRALDDQADERIGAGGGERPRQRLQFHRFGPGQVHRGETDRWERRRHRDEPFRRRERHRAQQQRIGDAEHRRIGAERQGQGDDDQRGGAGRAPLLADHPAEQGRDGQAIR